MYVFSEEVTLDKINKELGLNYPYFEDIAKRIIFVKSNEVVYHEDKFPYPNSKPDKINFKLSDTFNFMIFTKKNAIFKVKKEYNNGRTYY